MSLVPDQLSNFELHKKKASAEGLIQEAPLTGSVLGFGPCKISVTYIAKYRQNAQSTI